MFLSASRRYNKSGISLRRNIVDVTTWIWIGCSIATLVTSQQNFYTNGRYGKRQDPAGEASSFWSGSRYGRSGINSIGSRSSSSSFNEDDKIDGVSKDVKLSPRTDRFFLGSRYGKRTFSNDRSIDSLKHFETSLDFLISVGHLQTTDKEQLKILDQELKDNDNLITMKSGENYNSSGTAAGLIKNYGSLSENEFACFYTGVKNLYRCFHRRNYETEGSAN